MNAGKGVSMQTEKCGQAFIGKVPYSKHLKTVNHVNIREREFWV